jgi:Carboxypeptidase regulatory-like domain
MRPLIITLASLSLLWASGPNTGDINGSAVFTDNGKDYPAKFANVTVFYTDGTSRAFLRRVQTDGDGKLTYTDLSPGDYFLQFITQDGTYGKPYSVTVHSQGIALVTASGKPLQLVPLKTIRLGSRTGGKRALVASLEPMLFTDDPGSAGTDTSQNSCSNNAVTPGSLRGQIVSQGGQKRPISGAIVSLVPSNGSTPSTMRTDSNGCYTADLPSGDSTLFVDSPGFRTAVLSLHRASDDSIEVSLSSKGGDAPKEIELQADAGAHSPFIAQPVNAGRTFAFDQRFIQTLPLPITRNVDQLAFLVPGVAFPPLTVGGQGPGLAPGVGTAGEFSFNGLRSRDINFTVDGADQNDEVLGARRQGFLVPFPQSPETVEEAQYTTALADARFGRSLGGQVNVLSRTGGQMMHGKVYGLETGDLLRARSYYEFPNIAGGTSVLSSDSGMVLGGPLLPARFKTFFFLGYEYRDDNTRQQINHAVPTLAQRGVPQFVPNGSFSAAPVGDAVFSLYPLPNNPSGPYGPNTYTESVPAGGHANLGLVKVDQDFTLRKLPKWNNRITVRYGITDESTALPSVDDALGMSVRPSSRTQGFASFLTSTRGTLLNTFRLSFGNTQFDTAEVARPGYLPSNLYPGARFLLNAPLSIISGNKTLGVQNPVAQAVLMAASVCGPGAYQPNCGSLTSESLTGPVGQLQIAGFSPVGVDTFHFPQTRNDSTLQFADSISRSSGRHTIYAGIDIRGVRLDSTAQSNARPSILFGGLVTPAEQTVTPFSNTVTIPQQAFGPLELAALGYPSAVLQTLALTSTSGLNTPYPLEPSFPFALHRFEYDAFYQEYLRLTPTLQINFGYRLGYVAFPNDVDGRFANSFNITALTADAANAVSQCAGPFQARCGGLVGALQAAFPKDYSHTFGQNQWLNDPRFGFAWRPLERLTVRGGWGIYSDQFPAVVLTESQTPYPDFLSVNVAGAPVNGVLVNLANPASTCSSGPFGTACNPVLTPGSFSIANQSNPGGAPLTTPAYLGSRLGFVDPSLSTVQPGGNLRNPKATQEAVLAEVAISEATTASVGYFGNVGRNLLRASTPLGGPDRGSLLSDGTLEFVGGVPQFVSAQLLSAQNPDFNTFTVGKTVLGTTARSSYNSLQAELNHRRGFLQGGIAFTYSHTIDDASDYFDLAGAYALPQDSLNPSEKGSSNFDSRFGVAGYFLATVPTASNRFLRDWQAAGTYFFHTGQPFTVNTVYDMNRDGNLTDRLNSTEFLRIGGSNDPSVRLSLIGPSTLMLAPIGSDGAVGRNTFTAASIQSIDGAVFRTFYVAERLSATLRVEAFNLANHANFGIPVRVLEAPGFGKAVDLVTPGRTVQFGLRVSF